MKTYTQPYSELFCFETKNSLMNDILPMSMGEGDVDDAWSKKKRFDETDDGSGGNPWSCNNWQQTGE